MSDRTTTNATTNALDDLLGMSSTPIKKQEESKKVDNTMD